MRHASYQYAETLHDLTANLRGAARRAAIRAFVARLAKDGALPIAKDIVRDFGTVLADRAGKEEAVVTYAGSVPRDRVKRAFGTKATVAFVETPELTGGIVLRADDLRIDGSLRRRILELRRALQVG